MNDIRIVGTIALAIMIVICAIGMEWETKAQNFLLAIIVAAIFNFVIGSIFGPSTPTQAAEGFIGFSSKILCDCLLNVSHFMIFSCKKIYNTYFILLAEVFWTNWGPDYRYSEKLDQSFFSVFAIFFPSGK